MKCKSKSTKEFKLLCKDRFTKKGYVPSFNEIDKAIGLLKKEIKNKGA